jgi:hypothetical protein
MSPCREGIPVHLPVVASQTVALVAELTDVGPRVPHCGVIHLAVVMRYRVVSVLKGTYSGMDLYVVHGCPEMTRKMYSARSGSLQAFRPGERHRLVLEKLPLGDWPKESGPSIIDVFKDKRAPRFRATRSDLAVR